MHWFNEMDIAFRAEVEHRMNCPQQGLFMLDCGLYVLFFAEQLARNGEGIWAEVANISWMRCQVAGTILRHQYSEVQQLIASYLSVDTIIAELDAV
jgi:Ulp1 family protease